MLNNLLLSQKRKGEIEEELYPLQFLLIIDSAFLFLIGSLKT